MSDFTLLCHKIKFNWKQSCKYHFYSDVWKSHNYFRAIKISKNGIFANLYLCTWLRNHFNLSPVTWSESLNSNSEFISSSVSPLSLACCAFFLFIQLIRYSALLFLRAYSILSAYLVLKTSISFWYLSLDYSDIFWYFNRSS